MLEIRKARTTPYRPAANGMVERANKILGKALRCLVGKKQNDWDRFVPWVAAVMRASVNRATGFSPNIMMLGREVRLPSALWSPEIPNEPENPVEYVEKLGERLREVHRLARDNMKAEMKIAKLRYDVNARVRVFKPGDPVWYLNKAPKNKLQSRWLGPGVVRKKLTPFLFRILLGNREERTLHHDQLKPFLGSPPPWIKKESSRIQKGEAIVFCICHRPDDGSPMVQCEVCMEWFHCFCMGLTLSRAKALPVFRCLSCEKDQGE